MNQRYVLTTVKLKDLLSHKVQTQNLLFTFTWNVKRPQNNFVPIFNSKVGVRLIHECDLYSSKYGNLVQRKKHWFLRHRPRHLFNPASNIFIAFQVFALTNCLTRQLFILAASCHYFVVD